MCLFPMRASLDELNKIKFHHEGDLCLPCGKCTECISKRALEWSLRAKHEIASHDENCFITLTYDDEHLSSQLLVKNDFQKFIKRLRKKLKKPIRYMVSGEYGSQTNRPHFHAIIFGYNPANQKFFKNSKSGEALFTSEEITNLWPYGTHSIGLANEKTAYYIASYSLKASKHIITDSTTGEISIVSDYMDCSKRPAIGYEYFAKNYEQLIVSKTILPRYYLKKLLELNPTLHEHYENERSLKLKSRGTYEILAKYSIDQQKIQNDSEFRSTPDNSKTVTATKRYLKQERDQLHASTKDKK